MYVFPLGAATKPLEALAGPKMARLGFWECHSGCVWRTDYSGKEGHGDCEALLGEVPPGWEDGSL